MLMALAAMPVVFVSLVFVYSSYVALFIMALLGVVYSIILTIVSTQLQLMVERNYCGRVISIWSMIGMTIIPVSSFVGGVLNDLTQGNVVLIHSVSGIVVGLLMYPFLINKTFWVFISGSPDEENILQLQPLPTDGSRGL